MQDAISLPLLTHSPCYQRAYECVCMCVRVCVRVCVHVCMQLAGSDIIRKLRSDGRKQ
jgi:hypothetical protein